MGYFIKTFPHAQPHLICIAQTINKYEFTAKRKNKKETWQQQTMWVTVLYVHTYMCVYVFNVVAFIDGWLTQ